jgi:uncharacterized repeat protein (TIGR02543 family)
MKKILLAALTVMMFTVLGCNPDPDPNPGPGPNPPKPATFYTVTFDKNTTDPEATDSVPTKAETAGLTAPVNKVALPRTEPTRPDHFFDGWYLNIEGTGDAFTKDTAVTGNITVYAKWKEGYKVTYNSNGGSGVTPNFKEVIPPVDTVGALPSPDPTRQYFEFVNWTRNADGTGGEFTASTKVNASTGSFTVYAQWKFIGGTPVKQFDGTLVHDYPLLEESELEAHTAFTGTINADGSITYRSGAFRYMFPVSDATPPDYDIDDYDYFLITYTTDAPNTGDSGATIKQVDSGNNYPNLLNAQPWWSNVPQITSMRFFMNQATGGGVAFQKTGGASVDITITISAITYYKLDRYTVSFDLNGGDGSNPETVTGVYEGYGVTGFPSYGTWPTNPSRTPTGEETAWFFTGWFDGETMVTGSTPITKNTSLKAGWTQTEPPKVEMISPASGGSAVPIYRFTLTGTDTWADIKSITFKVLVTSIPSANARAHIIGNYKRADLNANGVFNTASSWGSERMVNINNGANLSNILNTANGTSGENLVGKWVTFTINIADSDIPPAPDPVPNNEYNRPVRYPAATDTGPFYLGAGITSSSAEGFTFYMKDVALVKTDGTTKIPNDDLETEDGGTKLRGFFFSGTSGGTCARGEGYDPAP